MSNVSALAIGQDEASWQAEFATDMMGTVRAVNAAMPFLEQSKAASIVVISSVSGREVDFAAGPYGVFKAALIHYAKGLSFQLAGERYPGQRAVAGQYIFSWRRLGKDRARQSGAVRAGDGAQSDRADGTSPRKWRGRWCSSPARRRVSLRGRTSWWTGR